MFNFENQDSSRLENGKAYNFDCEITGGVPCIRTTTGPIEKGKNIKVFAEGERRTFPTPEPKIILSEVKEGDFIGEYDSTEKRIRIRSYKVSEIKGNRVVALGADELFIFR